MQFQRNKLLLHIFIIVFFVILTNFNAVFSAEEPSPYSFLNNGVSARSAGLAGATVSFDYDGAGAFMNPALLSTRHPNNIHITYLKHLLDINSGNIMYVFADTTLGTFAASAVYTNYGSFDYYGESGEKTGGSFTGNMVSFNGSYATNIDNRLYGGVTLKLIFNQLEAMSGFAVAIDAGLVYKLPDARTNIGFSILNAGTEIDKFHTGNSRIPLDVRLGFNHRLEGLPLNFNLGFNHIGTSEGGLLSSFENINVGGELYIGDYVQVRVGFDNYVRKRFSSSQSKGLTGVAAGLGIVTDYLNIDYGLSIYSSDLLLHRFGINFKL